MRGISRRCSILVVVLGISGGMLLGCGGTAFGKTLSHHARARAEARFLRKARNALGDYLKHVAPVVQLASPAGSTTASSYNWSGYADTTTTHGAFTKVAGAWSTPAVTCTAEDTITSEWVGIDGWSDATVEQDGTLDWCFEGKALYYTWYEMYPAGTITVGDTLAPGDKIAASVTHVGTAYTLKLTDSTHPADSFTKTATCAAATCVDTSAEWIAERPAFSIGIAPLADYHTWSQTSGTATRSGTAGTISSFSPIAVDSVDATDSYDLSTTSALTAGKAFTTTWHNSY